MEVYTCSFGLYLYIEILKDEKGDDELLRKALARIESLEKQLSSRASEAGSAGGDEDGKNLKNKKDHEDDDPPIVTPDGVKVSWLIDSFLKVNKKHIYI